jgi:lysophospholipase L1-like esterase
MVAIALVVSTLAAIAVASRGLDSAGATPSAPAYYVALGDSLADGYEPTSVAPFFGAPTATGYANDIEKYFAKRIPGLQLENLGCAGETSATMVAGNCAGLAQVPGGYPDGSQLAQAEDFISHHTVAFITIDIGIDDTLVPCAPQLATLNTVAVAGCVASGIASDHVNVPQILSGLEGADTQGAPIYGLNYYDPFLGVAAFGDTAFASATLTGVQQINQELSADYAAASPPIPVADVWDAFSAGNATLGSSLTYIPKVSGHFVTSSSPVNVLAACALTWVCKLKAWSPTAQDFNDIHPNATGHALIASSVEQLMGWLPTR